MNDNYYKTKETVEEYIKLAKDVDGGMLQIQTIVKI